MTSLPKYHDHISEREADGTWEDCTFDAGLEFYRLAFDESRPATHPEAEALRKASGRAMTGGSNLDDFRKGVRTRYGRDIPAAITGWANLQKALKRNTVAVVQGGMKAFDAAHRLSRWQKKFDGSHAVCVIVLDDGTLWWCDPLATDNGYLGEAITEAELAKYVNAFSGKHIVAPVKFPANQEAAVANLTSYLPGYTANIKPKSNVRAAPSAASTKLRTTTANEPVQIVGTVKGSVDPANGSDVWYEFFKNGRSEYTAKDNIVDLTKPVSATPAPTYPDVRPQLAAAQAAAVEASKRIAELQPKAAIGDLVIRAVQAVPPKA